MDCVDGLNLMYDKKIDVLKKQDYYGKRVYIHIENSDENFVESKLDIGVHKALSIDQEEYCFDVCLDEIG